MRRSSQAATAIGPVVEKAVRQLRELDIETEVRVMSAHRTPGAARAFALEAGEKSFGVIIAAAGQGRTWPALSRRRARFPS